MVVQWHLTFWTNSLFNYANCLGELKFTKSLFARTPIILNCKNMFNTLPLADSLLSLKLSRVTVSVTNKYIAGNMWIVEESLSECGRMKIVFKQSCDKSKFATDFNRERTPLHSSAYTSIQLFSWHKTVCKRCYSCNAIPIA